MALSPLGLGLLLGGIALVLILLGTFGGLIGSGTVLLPPMTQQIQVTSIVNSDGEDKNSSFWGIYQYQSDVPTVKSGSSTKNYYKLWKLVNSGANDDKFRGLGLLKTDLGYWRWNFFSADYNTDDDLVGHSAFVQSVTQTASSPLTATNILLFDGQWSKNSKEIFVTITKNIRAPEE